MSEFVGSLHAVFESLGTINTRRMFGGHGVYHNELMFGLVADDELYLKADTETLVFFTVLNLPPFEYSKKGKLMKMSYYLAPEEIYDDLDAAKLWGTRAYEAALRSRKPKPKPKR